MYNLCNTKTTLNQQNPGVIEKKARYSCSEKAHSDRWFVRIYSRIGLHIGRHGDVIRYHPVQDLSAKCLHPVN
jgi:hypothetical protein